MPVRALRPGFNLRLRQALHRPTNTLNARKGIKTVVEVFAAVEVESLLRIH